MSQAAALQGWLVSPHWGLLVWNMSCHATSGENALGRGLTIRLSDYVVLWS